MSNIEWENVPREGGVYCMHDIDGRAVYAGLASGSKTRHLAARLREHFTQQNSSVVAHGRIDLLDIWYVDIWTTSNWNSAEEQLIKVRDPVFNRSDPTPTEEPINVDDPDVRLTICDEDTRSIRRKPQNRIRSKMDHIQRMVDSDQIALEALSRGREDRVKSAMNAADYHLSVLRTAIQEHYE